MEDFVEISDSVPELKLDNEINYYQNLAWSQKRYKSDGVTRSELKKQYRTRTSDWWPTLKVAGSYYFYDPYYPFGGLGNNYLAGAYLDGIF